ncbi:MAG: tRNA (guanosine(46)-N7)-methyltransferase TrmB [Bacteroidales bacterium]|nr:tRNA (guanosine(46)-N7)-methyltransferase TrmB [Bacteroidales bacterium]
MGKNKLKKFADMESFSHVFQTTTKEVLDGALFPLKGKWHSNFFHNNNPIVLELGCGKGEYTVGQALRNSEKNYIGVDIKGSRMWTGAKQSIENNLSNVAFVRTDIHHLPHFFDEGEIDEIWITFPDPQMKKCRKRLTSTLFLNTYRQVMKEMGVIHLKTDSNFLYTYTDALVKLNQLEVLVNTDNLYASPYGTQSPLDLKTYYEQQWLARGIDIKYLAFRLPSNTVLVEPEIDIPYDTYRSFGREGRSNLKLG